MTSVTFLLLLNHMHEVVSHYMVNVQIGRQPQIADSTPKTHLRSPLWLAFIPALLSTVEAICLFLVTANGLAVLLGASAVVLTPGALFFHAPAIRLPIFALASGSALLNLWLLWNQWRLRRSPAAQWRIRPLTAKERRRIFVIAGLSILALVLVAAELFFHYKLHGSPFA